MYLVPVALVLAGVALYNAGTAYFSTARAMQANWGIAVPEGVRTVEHQEERSFHGDGYRYTVFEVEDSAQLGGTFFDVDGMNAAELTTVQMGLVDGITTMFHPENRIAFPRSGLRKAEKSRLDNELLCLFDPATHRFYVYESMT